MSDRMVISFFLLQGIFKFFILYFLYENISFFLIKVVNICQNFYYKIYLRIQEKRVVLEVVLLCDSIRSYLSAGVLPQNLFPLLLEQRKWCFPIKNMFLEIDRNYRQGKGFGQCLDDFIIKMNLENYNKCLLFLVMSFRIAYYSGSSLIEIVEKVKKRTTDSIYIRQKLKSTTAQMRLQGIVILVAPSIIALLLAVISPSYIHFFFSSAVGLFLLGLVIFLNILAYISLRFILRVGL